jgi:hypothetical protein
MQAGTKVKSIYGEQAEVIDVYDNMVKVWKGSSVHYWHITKTFPVE